jgi:hypothetical protein
MRIPGILFISFQNDIRKRSQLVEQKYHHFVASHLVDGLLPDTNEPYCEEY